MKRLALAVGAALLGFSGDAWATGFTEIGQDIRPRTEAGFKLEGYFRTRGEYLYNLDLDRGLTPSGLPLYPVPSDGGQSLYGGDLRLRTDLSVYAPGGTVAVKVRVDTLDNVAAGSSAVGNYAAATTQTSPAAALRVKRAYGTVLTPFGVLSAGRMGNHWGLGMLANGGDCADCDSGDAADRVAFLTPLLGHVWALAYDISATGPVTTRKDGVRQLDFEPTDNVQTVTFAVLNFRDEGAPGATPKGRRRLGRVWSLSIAPVAKKRHPVDLPAHLDAGGLFRGAGGASRLHGDGDRRVVQGDAAVLPSRAGRSDADGADRSGVAAAGGRAEEAREVEAGRSGDGDRVWLPGWAWWGRPRCGLRERRSGAGVSVLFPAPNGTAPRAGDLDGPQANVPRDNRVDNFRFSPDYRIDRVLFREIIGTVTDAIYARPHARVVLFRNTAGQLSASAALVASWAAQAASTPSGQGFLGLELDPTLVYQSHDGFALALDHGVFFPGAAFDNPSARLTARTAQVIRARLLLRF